MPAWVRKVKGLSATNWWFQNSHRDVGYRIRSVVSDTWVSMCEARWVFEAVGDHSVIST